MLERQLTLQRSRLAMLGLSLLCALILLLGLAYSVEKSWAIAGNVDLQISQSADPEPVVAGTLLTYTLTVFNDSLGPGIATDVILSDTLPRETLFNWAPDDCLDGAEPRCLLGNMAPGDQRTLTITVRVDPLVRGPITNTATVSAREKDNKLNDNRAEAISTVIGRADLEIGKTMETETVFVGSWLTYTLAVTNHGPSTANNVVLTDLLPVETELKTFPPFCTGQAVLICTLGALEPGQMVIITLAVEPMLPGRITNRATVSGTETDPALINNTDIEVTDVLPPTADLAVAKAAQPSDVLAGQMITYTVNVLNNGPSAAHDIVLTDTLPAQVQLGRVLEPQTECTAATYIICTWSQLASQEAKQLILTATVQSGLMPGTVITGQVSIRATETDNVLENNQAEVISTVRSPEQTDLELSKAVRPQLVRPGDVLTYTMMITNRGPAVAHNVALIDEIPVQVTWGGLKTSFSNCTFTSGLNCNWSELAANVTLVVEYTTTVKSDVLEDTLILNDASVTGTEPDFRPSSNSDSASSRVISANACVAACRTFLPMLFQTWPVWERVGNRPAGVSQFFAVAACGDQLLAGSNKGLYSNSTNGSTWQPVAGVPDIEVRGITFAGNDCSRAFVATVGEGIYAGTAGLPWTWVRIDSGMDNARTVVVRPAGTSGEVTLFAGGDFGIYWSPVQASYEWRQTSIGQLVVGLTRHPDNQTIFAATWGRGIYGNDADGGPWNSLATPSNPNAYEVASDPNGEPLAVGVTSGLFCLVGGDWQKGASEFLDRNTHSLAFSQGTLYAGRKGVGVLTSRNDCQSWSLMNAGLGNIDQDFEIRDLHVAEDGWLYAATTSGIWRWPLR